MDINEIIGLIIDLHNDMVESIGAIRDNKITLSKLNLILSANVVAIRETLSAQGIKVDIDNGAQQSNGAIGN